MYITSYQIDNQERDVIHYDLQKKIFTTLIMYIH